MPKQKKPSLPRGRTVASGQVKRWLAEAELALLNQHYEAAIQASQKALAVLPARAPQRADALECLGNACGLLKRFEEAYQAFLEAVQINPTDAVLWYNLGQSARFTSRTGESLGCFERALELETDSARAKQLAGEVKFARKLVANDLKSRGRGFSLGQLIEQQRLFHEGVNLMSAGHWAQAEERFRSVIAMADVLPQPWGNLGLALIMQHRFDEAEAALRRALKIDSKYDPARKNLASLPEIRRTGELPPFQIRDPLSAAKVSQTIVFDRE